MRITPAPLNYSYPLLVRQLVEGLSYQKQNLPDAAQFTVSQHLTELIDNFRALLSDPISLLSKGTLTDQLLSTLRHEPRSTPRSTQGSLEILNSIDHLYVQQSLLGELLSSLGFRRDDALAPKVETSPQPLLAQTAPAPPSMINLPLPLTTTKQPETKPRFQQPHLPRPLPYEKRESQSRAPEFLSPLLSLTRELWRLLERFVERMRH